MTNLSVDHYEIREAYMLEHLKCFDCEISVLKQGSGDYYCPSCGDTASE